MDRGKGQRYGGHLVLVGMALVILLAGRIIFTDRATAVESTAGDTAVTTASTNKNNIPC